MERKKITEGIRDALGGILLIAVYIRKIVLQESDSDIVFDAGGKAAIIILLFVFFIIYYLQSRKMGKGQRCVRKA